MTDIWATPISDTSASLLFMVDLHARHRRSIRLPGYDYAQAGWYFVTICTRERKCLFGDVEGGTMRLNPDGQIVKELWEDLPNHFQYLTLEQFTLMPNHLHGISIIAEHRRGTACRAPTVFRSVWQTRTRFATNNNSFIQIRGPQIHQPYQVQPQRPGLATELLRTRHPQRKNLKPNKAIHHR